MRSTPSKAMPGLTKNLLLASAWSLGAAGLIRFKRNRIPKT